MMCQAVKHLLYTVQICSVKAQLCSVVCRYTEKPMDRCLHEHVLVLQSAAHQNALTIALDGLAGLRQRLDPLRPGIQYSSMTPWMCMRSVGCSALPGECRWEDSLVKTAKKLKMGAGYNEGTDVGPMISPEAKQRAERIIGSAEEQVRTCSAHIYLYVARWTLSGPQTAVCPGVRADVECALPWWPRPVP